MAKINLTSIYRARIVDRVFDNFLYTLLSERLPEESISHKGMPSLEMHYAFIDCHPYKEWYIILDEDYEMVGTIYITNNNEIGVAIKKEHRLKGYAKAAIIKILTKYSNEQFYANINPLNQKSIDMFKKLSFNHIQNTYRIKT